MSTKGNTSSVYELSQSLNCKHITLFKKNNLRVAYLKCLRNIVLRVSGHIYNRVQSISRKLRDTGHVRLSYLHIPFGLSTYPTDNNASLNYKD
jgi:hypothetical protein